MEPFVLVIFGGAGDLSRRMLIPTLLHTHRQGDFPAAAEIVGVGLPDLTDAAYRELMAQSLGSTGAGGADEQLWPEFRERLSFIGGGFEDPGTYQRLLARIQELSERCGGNIIYYLAVPPSAAPVIVQHLDELGLCQGQYHTKVIIEKPFGHDRESAVALNRMLLKSFEEAQIYRMDFYLGMETVQSILYMRMANPAIESLWDARHIDNVQISVAETIGIGTRGRFYEETGVVRDMIQNHLLQILTLVAMDLPATRAAEAIRDEKVKVLTAVAPLETADCVRGQYGAGALEGAAVAGYRQEEDVDPASVRETFFAGRLRLENTRWAGVPFYLRTGKRMARDLAEVNIRFRRLPGALPLAGPAQYAEVLSLGLFPDDHISLHLGLGPPEAAGGSHDSEMSLSYAGAMGREAQPPYARLLVDVMRGDLTWFVRQDGIERLWSIVDLLNRSWAATPPADFPNYAAGSWGPPAADELLQQGNRQWLVSGRGL